MELWASPDNAVILLSNRSKREDRFRTAFLDQSYSAGSEEDSPLWAGPAPASALIDDGSRDSKVELEADSFAQVSLIPTDVLALIPQLSSEAAVMELAARIGVSAGVVAGRYQYETNDYRKHNRLRRQVPHQLFEVPV